MFAVCCASVWTGGCLPRITAVPANRDKVENNYPAFSDHRFQGLDIDSVNFLAFFGLTERFADDPADVIRKLYSQGELFGGNTVHEVLVDLCYYQAKQESDSTHSAAYYLTAAQIAWQHLFDSGDEPYQGRMWRHYNNAALKLFEYLKDNRLLLASGYELEPICGPRVYFEAPESRLAQPPEQYELIEACANWVPRHNQVFSFRRGIGIPLILHAPVAPVHSDDTTIKSPICEPATLLLRFAPAETGNTRRQARWEFADSIRYEAVSDRGVSIPLAMDITTPLAYALNQPNPFKDIYFLLNPDKMADLEGLYMTQPWDPEKIPVILTHGLMSNPRTWAQMLNSLYLDPRLRRHYQFWCFAYPTGNPLLYSAFQLRSALQEAEQRFGTGNDNFHQMVLIGHSMGGLLTKTMITNSGEEFQAFVLRDKKAEWAALTPEQREYVEHLLNFQHPDYITRAIFIATPHRGSEIATWSITHWASRSIALPARLYDVAKQGIAHLGLVNETEVMKIRTGLDNLAPDDRVLQKLNELNFQTVPYHSVMGNEEKANAVGGTDGIVPYASSHLDGAISELVVKSNHSVQQVSQAIAEVNRILIEHLISCGRLTPDGREIDRPPAVLPELPFPSGAAKK